MGAAAKFDGCPVLFDVVQNLQTVLQAGKRLGKIVPNKPMVKYRMEFQKQNLYCSMQENRAEAGQVGSLDAPAEVALLF